MMNSRIRALPVTVVKTFLKLPSFFLPPSPLRALMKSSAVS